MDLSLGFLSCSIDLCFCFCASGGGLVAKSCLTCDPMNCSLPGSSVHRTSQAKILEWVAIPFSRGSFQPRDWTQISCIAGGFFTNWATREAPPGSTALGWALHPETGVLITRSWRQRDTHGEEHHVETETKTGMMSRQVEECPELPATTRSRKPGKADYPLGLPEGASPDDTSLVQWREFQIFELQDYKRINLCCLKPLSLW